MRSLSGSSKREFYSATVHVCIVSAFFAIYLVRLLSSIK
jgi:hypothetical protein